MAFFAHKSRVSWSWINSGVCPSPVPPAGPPLHSGDPQKLLQSRAVCSLRVLFLVETSFEGSTYTIVPEFEVSMKNKNQEKNLIETIKQSCRKLIKERTGKKPFTNINIARV